MKKIFFGILALFLTLSIKSTEVYICKWLEQQYGCELISEKIEEPLEPFIVQPPITLDYIDLD